MSVKTLLIKSLVGLLLLVLSGGTYLYHLSPPERWLLFRSSNAQAYADAMLEKGTAPEELSNHFIDVVIVSNSGERTVLFSPHDDHDVAVIYAPSHTSESLTYEKLTAKRIRKNWYALP
jgi:hypothetical protein